jgi:hypothetical protein
MHKWIALAFTAAVTLAAATTSLAQPIDERTAQAACQDDAFRYCQATIPDRERTLACLISNKDGISGACRAVLADLIPPDKPAKKQPPRKRPKGGPIDLTPAANR